MDIRKIILKINFSVVLSQILGKLINYLYCNKKKKFYDIYSSRQRFFINTVKISVYTKIYNNAKKFEAKKYLS